MNRLAIACFALLFPLVLGACPGGSNRFDAGGGNDDGGPPDAAIDGGLASCMPAGTLSVQMETYRGTLTGAAANFAPAQTSCTVVDAPFGVEAQGPDQVVAVVDLQPGVDYAVRLVSNADLAFYVGSGCDDSEPAAIRECMLFVDGSTGSVESGRFTAPDNGEVVVVIDHFRPEPPTDGDYSLQVYPVRCDDSDVTNCTRSEPICRDFHCVQCGSSFDCGNVAEPICEVASNRCTSGENRCLGDDPAPIENRDDGPAGARDITPTLGTPTLTAGSICNAPTSELDYFRFTVPDNGGAISLELAWDDPSINLDMQVTDANGVGYGLSLYERPETVSLSFLPAGVYFVRINYFDSNETTVAVDYTLAATRLADASCSTVADCAGDYRNQVFRADCTDGACRYQPGTGQRLAGEICDGSSDCASGICPAFPFTANADTRSHCSVSCSGDNACAALGAGYLCTTYLADNMCVQPCTRDSQCPVIFGVAPALGPWFRLSCDVATGKCGF